MKQIAADEEKRKALAEEMPEIKVDVNKVLLMANVDPDNVTELDEEEYKKALSEESETLSGLQKNFRLILLILMVITMVIVMHLMVRK